MNIGEMLGVPPQKGLVGIEIEVEGHNLPLPGTVNDEFVRFWTITQDGSLRGEAFEYVFRRPLSREGTFKTLLLLEDQYVTHKSRVDDSVRAGIHAHINVQDLSLSELCTMLIIYYCLEDVLVDFCGKDRVGNHFCLRASDAEYVLYALYNSLTSGGACRELSSDTIRYASMNLMALFKYGSLEFRALRSTRDWNRIMTWVDALLAVKASAQAFQTPRAVMEALSLDGGQNFLSRVLGHKLALEFNTKNCGEKIYEGARRVQEFAFDVDLEKVKILNPGRHSGWERNMHAATAPVDRVWELEGVVLEAPLDDRDEAPKAPIPKVDGLELVEPPHPNVDKWDVAVQQARAKQLRNALEIAEQNAVERGNGPNFQFQERFVAEDIGQFQRFALGQPVRGLELADDAFQPEDIFQAAFDDEEEEE